MAVSDTASDFPVFPDGDVAIVVSIRRTYRLHSQTLRQKSSYFARKLQPALAPKFSPSMKRAGLTPWRFQLYQDPQDEADFGHFISMPLNDSGRVRGNAIPLRAPSATIGNNDGDDCWEWLFGCFYGRKPNFDSTTFGATVNDCVALIEAADTIGAIGAIREAVELALLQQDNILWKSIATSPVVWAELGRRVQSPVVFKEAVIHIVGQWNMLEANVKNGLPADIRQLCQKKWDELELNKRAIELRIAGHYPKFMCQNAIDRPQRTVYANHIYMWMAVAHFRHYVSQSGNDCENRMAKDGGYAWYKKFATGGSSYLDHEDMKMFHQFFPMSGKACGILEASLNVLKEETKSFVKGLMVNRTHVNVEKLDNVQEPWLTCVLVESEDMPWNQTDDGVRVKKVLASK